MSSIENSANPKVQNANRRSQFFEIRALLSVVLIVCALIETRLRFWVWLIASITVLVISFLLAIRYQMMAIDEYRKARGALAARQA